ncbi:alpha/beta hydrolase [Kitasatospora sp. HPMI-4]|uniref:alpha/beta hydrolase n=1 Tax=Kitasatospora sp. HPMI-4 TaxID=3448443 RepID=UPI003F1AA081
MNVSLLQGWLPVAMKVVAALALLAAIGWRDSRWRLRRLPVALGVTVLLTAAVALGVINLSGITDPLPFSLWVWLGVAVMALAVLVVGWRGGRWLQRASVPVAVLLAVATGANVINQETGYYPTVGDAIGELTNQPLPSQITVDEAKSITGKTSTGRIVTVDIPSTASNFTHRQELVYLPPAWFRSKTRPKLPVVEMIGGEFSAPDNWVRIGNATHTADAYAKKHKGFAPVLVFVDPSGGFKVDTECANGPAGNAQDHLIKDVPPYVESTFGTATDPRKWGVAGWSMGGTCALTMAVTHPEVFAHFLDISGDLGPNTGNKEQTIAKLYGGDAEAWAANDPMTVLAHHAKYPKGVTGMLMAGDQETRQTTQMKQQLEPALHKAGYLVHTTVLPGKHVWQFAATGFEHDFSLLAQQVGTPGSRPATAAKPEPAPALP